MPHIFVTYYLPMSPAEARQFLISLGKVLPIVCAEYLGCDDKGGKLTKDDFSVTFLPKGEFDTLTHRLEIRIEAGLFPGRLVNVDERADKISRSLELRLCHHESMRGQPFKLDFYVWVRLSSAGFSTGEIVGLP